MARTPAAAGSMSLERIADRDANGARLGNDRQVAVAKDRWILIGRDPQVVGQIVAVHGCYPVRLRETQSRIEHREPWNHGDRGRQRRQYSALIVTIDRITQLAAGERNVAVLETG